MEVNCTVTGLDRKELDRVRYALSSQGHAYAEVPQAWNGEDFATPGLAVTDAAALLALAVALNNPDRRPGVVYRGEV
jgi:hypothetical protein